MLLYVHDEGMGQAGCRALGVVLVLDEPINCKVKSANIEGHATHECIAHIMVPVHACAGEGKGPNGRCHEDPHKTHRPCRCLACIFTPACTTLHHDVHVASEFAICTRIQVSTRSGGNRFHKSSQSHRILVDACWCLRFCH